MDELEFFVNQLKEDDFGVKLQAIQMLGEFGDPRALKPLLELYSDKDWQIRNAAVEAICKIKSPEVIPILTEYLRHDDPNVRNAAMQTLENLGEDVVPPLLEALTDKDEDVRIFACNTLGNLGEKRAVDGLIKALDDENENVYYAAAEALGRIKDKKAVPALIKKLNEKDIWERFVLITSLGEIGDETAIKYLIPQLEIEELKGVTIEALGKIGFEEALPHIIKELNSSNDEDIKLDSFKAIFKIAQNTYNYGRIERNKFLQEFTLKNLSKINFKNLEEVLTHIFEGEDNELKYQILQILNWAGETLPAKILLPLLKIEELEDIANELLIKFSYNDPQILINLFNQETDNTLKYHIIKALGYANDDKINQFLNKLLEEDDTEIVIAASEALILSFADISARKDIIDKLFRMLDSDDEDIKESAERIIVILAHNEEIQKKLSETLKSNNIKAIKSTIKILGISNSSDHINQILSFIEHENPEIRAEVYRAIDYLAKIEMNREMIINSEFYDKILLGIYDTDENVQIEAIYALGSLQDDKSYEALKNILFDPALNKLKPYIVRSIKNYYNKELKDIFIELVLDENTDIETKLIIVQSLGIIGDSSIIEPLSDLLFEIEEDDLKSEILLTFGEIGDEEILDYLFPFLEEDNWFLKNSAILAMKNIKSNEVKEKLIEILQSDINEGEKIIKHSCVKILKNFPDEKVLQNLIPLLNDSDLMYETYESIFNIIKTDETLVSVVEKFLTNNENDIIIKRLLISILKELKIKIDVDFFVDYYEKTEYNSLKMMILKYLKAINHKYYSEFCEKIENDFLKTLCKWLKTNSLE